MSVSSLLNAGSQLSIFCICSGGSALLCRVPGRQPPDTYTVTQIDTFTVIINMPFIHAKYCSLCTNMLVYVPICAYMFTYAQICVQHYRFNHSLLRSWGATNAQTPTASAHHTTDSRRKDTRTRHMYVVLHICTVHRRMYIECICTNTCTNIDLIVRI